MPSQWLCPRTAPCPWPSCLLPPLRQEHVPFNLHHFSPAGSKQGAFQHHTRTQVPGALLSCPGSGRSEVPSEEPCADCDPSQKVLIFGPTSPWEVFPWHFSQP
jgi:hypothetical protein